MEMLRLWPVGQSAEWCWVATEERPGSIYHDITCNLATTHNLTIQTIQLVLEEAVKMVVI